MFIVTGATGFIGRYVVKFLIDHQLPFQAYARTPRAVNDEQMSAIQIIDDYSAIPSGPEAVLIHLAEPARLPDDEDAVNKCHEVQKQILTYDFSHVVYVSSGSVYGNQNMNPNRPDRPVSQFNPYTKLKLAGEAATAKVGGTILRLGNTIGIGMDSSNVISDVLNQLDESGPVLIRDGTPICDFIDVTDVAAGICAAAQSQIGGIFNLGTGLGVSIHDLVRLCLTNAKQAEREIVETGSVANEPSCLVLDISETVLKLGWKPKIDLSTTISSVCHHA